MQAMEQEALLIFHTAFALVILLSVIFLLRWRKMSSEKKPILTVVYFVLLQILAYVLLCFTVWSSPLHRRTARSRLAWPE